MWPAGKSAVSAHAATYGRFFQNAQRDHFRREVDRGRKSIARESAGAFADRTATDQLSGVARGSEWQADRARASGRLRPDDCARGGRRIADPCSFQPDAGSDFGECHLRSGSADTSCALQRRRPASSFREPVIWGVFSPSFWQNSGVGPPLREARGKQRPPTPMFFISVDSKGG